VRRALLFSSVMILKRPASASHEGCPREPIHQVEAAVEQRNRQRNSFRRGQGRKLCTIMEAGLRMERPPIRRRVIWKGLHHRSPRANALEFCERAGMYGRPLWRFTSLPRHWMYAATAAIHKFDDRACRNLGGGPKVTSEAEWRDEPGNE
jgi:hypothetical protein